MENRAFVNIRSDRFNEEILLETSGDLSVREFQNDVLKILNWPIEENGETVHYHLRSEEKEIDQSDSIHSAGIGNFETIWISPDDKGGHNIAVTEKDSMLEPQLSTQTPFWTVIPVDQPTLIHPDGYLILLDKPPVLIGRNGGEKPVQVDLSEFEKGRLISSRCHAEIIAQKGEYAIRAFKTRNGTFVDREELKPGELRVLNNNDIIQFGTGGVRLVFRKP
jgi:hypothetical protein